MSAADNLLRNSNDISGNVEYRRRMYSLWFLSKANINSAMNREQILFTYNILLNTVQKITVNWNVFHSIFPIVLSYRLPL